MKTPIYKDLQLARKELKQSLKNKSGVYQLVNLINGKSYVGSSVNLYIRLKQYSNPNFLAKTIKNSNSAISLAILKYGFTNFGFRVLELTPLDSLNSKTDKRNLLISKEQYYMDLIKPEYNILPKAGSPLGTINTEETKKNKSLAQLNRDTNRRGKTLTPEFLATYVEKHGMAKSINMLNEQNEIIGSFPSIQIAAEITGISRIRISRCLRGIRKQIEEKGKIYKFSYAC